MGPGTGIQLPVAPTALQRPTGRSQNTLNPDTKTTHYAMTNQSKLHPGEFSRDIAKWQRGVIADIEWTPKVAIMQLRGIVAVTESIVAVPVSTSSIASICVQITGISCWSTASGPPPAISPAKPGGSTRSGRV